MMTTITNTLKLSDVITIEIKESIAIIWIDHQKEKMNVVSPDLINIFDEVFDSMLNNPEIKAAVLISGKKDFIAGADIKSFNIEKEGDFRPFQAKGHKSLDQLEKGSKPVVAAINGTCFGLGTELALACHARVCTDAPHTKFALPEVKLGILPGGGGTQRLPRLIGLQKALDMMLTGKNIFPSQAKKMGLVDEITSKDKLLQVAIKMAKNLLEKPISHKRKKSIQDRFLDDTSIGQNIVFNQARKKVMKMTQGNYPAVPAIIDCVEAGYKKGAKAGYEAELVHFERLMLTPESAALRSLFFNMTENKKNPFGEVEHPIKTLGMIGAGFMGAGIAEVTVNNGFNVILKDINAETIATAKSSIWKSIAKKLKYKSIAKTKSEEIIGRVKGQLTYENFEHADIIIEAVLEKMELKKKIIEDVEANAKPAVIFASNTSSLSVTEMAKHAKKPEQVIGMHYFSPVPKMPLLEIVTTEFTADWVKAACYDFGVKQGKTVIVVKDSPGFYVNRILAPYINECLMMVEEGVAFDFVDKQLSKKGFPVGPITLLDEVGLDIAAHIVSSSAEVVQDRPGFEISYSIVKMFDDGRMGKKNKKGFYLYDNEKGKKQGPDKTAYQYFKGDGTKTMDAETVQNRGIMLMLNEAVMCLEEGIIDGPSTGDIGGVFGIGFLPFTGGPFRYIDQLGAEKVVEIMESLRATYGEKFKPVKTLVEMGERGARFHD